MTGSTLAGQEPIQVAWRRPSVPGWHGDPGPRYGCRCFEDAFDLNGRGAVAVDPARHDSVRNASRRTGRRRGRQLVPATSSSSSSSRAHVGLGEDQPEHRRAPTSEGRGGSGRSCRAGSGACRTRRRPRSRRGALERSDLTLVKPVHTRRMVAIGTSKASPKAKKILSTKSR